MILFFLDWVNFVDTNVCAVDWSTLSFDNYITAALVNTHIVADFITDFILRLNELGMSPNNMTVAGHSLGGHIAGFIGKNLRVRGFTLSNIYGKPKNKWCVSYLK